MTKHLTIAFAFLLACPALLDAQQPPRSTASGLRPATTTLKARPSSLDILFAVEPGGVATVVPGGAGQAPGEPDARAQLLRQQKFDRRPSAILAAWSKPEPVAVDDDPELQLPPEPEVEEGAAPDPKLIQERQQIEAKRQQRELEILARDVTLGRWPAVGAWIEGLDEKEREGVYVHLLKALSQPPKVPNQQRQVPPQFQEKNAFSFDDLVGIAAAAPGRLKKVQVTAFAPLVQLALADGRSFEELLVRLRAETARPDDVRVLDRRQVARLLAALGREVELGEFLRPAAEAAEAGDREALNLLARHHLALHRKDGGRRQLELAWEVTQAALAAGEIGEQEKAEALRRAVSLAPRIREEFGQSWLDESFTTRPERGREILATLGSQASRGQQEHAQDVKFRREGLRLQKTAVDALLAKAPERAEEWRGALRIMAATWQREAEHSYQFSEASSMGPMMQQDPYGNIFYVGGGGRGSRSPVAALEPADLLDFRPEGPWLELLEAAVRPQVASVIARLYLKVNDEERAFPAIEDLARTHPEQAKALADEFLRVWIRNHDPNAARNRTSSYLFAYGYNQRAAGIPLTRSKQDRNLKDLAAWVERLRGLGIAELDQRLLVQAFTSSHSTAEVYRLETIEAVFGGLDALEPKTIAELAQRMRANLVGVWRQPRTQQAAKTNRKQKDIEREVSRGYDVARRVVERALAKYPDDWRLTLAIAALLHDQLNYAREVAGSTDFAAARDATLQLFGEAARLYAAALDPDSSKEESSQVYETWFHAGLGASDLGAVDERTTADADQPALIKAAIEALPGEAAERHRARFANSLFTRLSSVNPAVKFRYLDAGFSIVGDQPQAREARKVFDYYRDLVTEIRLDVQVDGDDEVGYEQPFGIRVDLLHTREIERESGGFAKYLQNQNNVQNANNYGRPTENYRDKFEEAARAALAETFEVLSVTFNGEGAGSKATEDYGWRRTPYAYFLVRSRRPEVDKIPPLKIDLDFLDTSGYVVLPIASATLPIDASVEPDSPRPYGEVQITQILDEREAESGELALEIKAQARGLVPALDDLVDLAPDDFEVVTVDDQGVSVSRFADDQDAVVSERLWTISMRARSGLEEQPATFRFAAAADPDAEVVYQRYDDADLMPASAEVELGARYGDGMSPWWLLIPIALGIAVLVLIFRTRPGPAVTVATLQMPARITPFTVLGLLRDLLRTHDGLNDAQRREIQNTVATIERHYFAATGGDEPDLRGIAEDWVRRAG